MSTITEKQKTFLQKIFLKDTTQKKESKSDKGF